MARDNKAIWENNKYFLSIYLFFFSTFFLDFFISLQILSVCLMYILYIFIYQYNATPEDPHALKWRPEQWQEPSQPCKWTIGPLA